MKISSPSRKTSTRKPSHLGSKIHPSPSGKPATRFASIGKRGGLSGRCIARFVSGALRSRPANEDGRLLLEDTEGEGLGDVELDLLAVVARVADGEILAHGE